MTTLTIDLDTAGVEQMKAIAAMLTALAGPSREVGTPPIPAPAAIVPPSPQWVPVTVTVPAPEQGVEAATFVGTPNPADRDVRGFPWDERIHSSSRAVNADGTWRQKRGVDKWLVETVEAELKGAPLLSDVAAAEAAAGLAPLIPPPPPPPAPAAVPEPAAPAVSLVPAVPPAPVATSALTFPAVMAKITAAMAAGKFDMPTLATTCQSLGLPEGIPSLFTRMDAAPSLLAALGIEA